jgi:hypothetical protein
MITPASARRRRNELLLKFISAMTAPTILDVGGTLEYWHGIPRGVAKRVVLLNTFPQAVIEAGFEAVVGDARDLSRFGDGEFDLVFSNSVIGHVGGFTDQERMAREICRIGKRHFVQTPNHTFPIDWRTRVPFFHLLPSKTQAWCFLHFPVGTYRRATGEHEAWDWATRVRNIRRHEIDLLFPESIVLNERVFGLTKSFMIHNFIDRSNIREIPQSKTSRK